jgi:hypothetical protein
MDYEEDSMVIFNNPNFRTVSNLISNQIWDKNNLIIDGIMCTAGDMKLIADTFTGNRVIFSEMELTEKQLLELVKWDGPHLKFNFCGHDNYDFNMFFRIMNQWEGELLTIGYQDIPRIYTIKDPSYNITFEECNVERYLDFPNAISFPCWPY